MIGPPRKESLYMKYCFHIQLFSIFEIEMLTLLLAILKNILTLIVVNYISVGKACGLPRGVPYSHKNVACHTDHGHGVAVFGKLVWQQGKKNAFCLHWETNSATWALIMFQ